MRIVADVINKVKSANQVKDELRAIADTMASEENRNTIETACGIISDYVTAQLLLPIKEE